MRRHFLRQSWWRRLPSAWPAWTWMLLVAGLLLSSGWLFGSAGLVWAMLLLSVGWLGPFFTGRLARTRLHWFSNVFEETPGLSGVPSERLEDLAVSVEVAAAARDLVQGFIEATGPLKSGWLLVGPEGTGKRHLARSIAGQAGAQFYPVEATGLEAEDIQRLFNWARQNLPAVIFIRHLERLPGAWRPGQQAGPAGAEHRPCPLQVLQMEMEKTRPGERLLVLASTRALNQVDDRLLTTGGFMYRLEMRLPDHRQRQEILSLSTRSIRLAPDVDLNLLARLSDGWSGADLAHLSRLAASKARKAGRSSVGMEDYGTAVDEILLDGIKFSKMHSLETG